jgi:hypothetical protein
MLAFGSSLLGDKMKKSIGEVQLAKERMKVVVLGHNL